MENFKGKSLDGEWWSIERPDEHYKGVLLLDEKHHGNLTLRGTEDQLASLPCDALRRTFFGRLGKYPYNITLFNVGLQRGPSRTYPKKPDQETDAELFTNNILTGAHVESEEQPFLNGALIHLTGLEEWCDTTGFSGGLEKLEHAAKEELATETVSVSFQASASPRYDVGDGRSLRLLSQYRGPFVFHQSKSVTLAERNTIELVFPKPISIRMVLAEITIWQNLITFGLRRPSYITR